MKKAFLQSLDRAVNTHAWSRQQPSAPQNDNDDCFDSGYSVRSSAKGNPTVNRQKIEASPQQSQVNNTNSNEPTVTVSMDSFLKVLEQHNKQQQWLQQFAIRATAAMTNVDDQELYIVKHIKVTGEELNTVKNDDGDEQEDSSLKKHHKGAIFTLDFHVDVLENVTVRYQQELWRKKFGKSTLKSKKWKKKSWTSVALLENICNNVSLRKCLIKRQNQNRSSSDGENLESDENQMNESLDNNLNDNLEDLECHIGILDNSIVMLCGEPGLYHIQLVVDVSVDQARSPNSGNKFTSSGSSIAGQNSTSPRTISLYFASEAVQNELDFKIHHEDVQVKVTPSLFVQKRKVTAQETESAFTQITCSYPSTRILTINWTPKIKVQTTLLLLEESSIRPEEDKDQKIQLVLTLTSQQNTFHAIGEGLIRSTAVFNYSIVNGSVTQFEIVADSFGAPFKILSVHGDGIKDWNVFDQKDLTEDERNLEDAEQLNRQQLLSKKILKIQFKYGIEGSYNLRIQSELEMEGTSAKAFAPSFTSQNATRETGTIAVVARTNVEIKEEGRKFLRKIDPSELPPVQRQSPFPILHSYRFLEKGHELHLNVTRHEDVQVLCACIEGCTYDVTLSSGKLLHKIQMHVRNTAKQYLRIELKNTAEIWSTTVDGQSVKPLSEAKKQNKLILIPLSQKNARATMVVEFVFTIPSVKMEGRGDLKINLARFDTPINFLNLSLFLPKDFNFSEFDGDAEEVLYFQHCHNNSLKESNDTLGGSQQLMVKSNSNRSRFSEMLGAVGATAGLKPVNLGSIDATTGMKQFKFERVLILENQSIELAVDYKEIKKGMLERRTTSGSQTWVYISALIVIILALLAYFYL